MNELDAPTESAATQPARRAALKGAAWSVPVIAMAVGAPMAAASVNNATVNFTDTDTGLLTLRVLDGSSVITAQALVTVPTELTFTNGPGAIVNETATVTITVGRPSGINIPVGRARGFGVYSYDGTASTAGERTLAYQRTPITNLPFGFPATTFTRTVVLNVADSGMVTIPVEFGLAGTSDLVSISALARFPVTYTIAFADGPSYTATSQIRVPVGAGIL